MTAAEVKLFMIYGAWKGYQEAHPYISKIFRETSTNLSGLLDSLGEFDCQHPTDKLYYRKNNQTHFCGVCHMEVVTDGY
jgi:hypothetical protein